jgi:hypothetical protein
MINPLFDGHTFPFTLEEEELEPLFSLAISLILSSETI